MAISDQLRQLITESDLSQRQIAREVGLPQSTMSDFMRGSRITIESVDRIASYFGVRLTVPRKVVRG